jgi:branched-chain amino acid transport system permease protein
MRLLADPPVRRRLAAVVIPAALALLVLPYLLPPYPTILLSYGLIFGIAALGYNLLLGYTGLLSFGHSAYFGVGAYAVAFLVRYLDVTSMEVLLVGSVVASALVAGLFGVVCVGYTRIFFAILTLALSQVVYSLALKFYWVSGGTDGLRVPTPTLLGGILGPPADKVYFLTHGYYYFVLLAFFACVGLMWVLVNSPFGKALQAIRDNETRAEFVGIRVRPYRWLAFLISGVFTGLAGALWAPLNGLVTPEIIYWPFSGRIVFLTVLGGFRTFLGPVIGAIVYNYLESYAVATTVYWQFVLGAVLVFLVLVMPAGIVGTVGRLASRLRRPVDA